MGYNIVLNVICGLSLIFNHFKAYLCYVYSLQYHMWTFIHKQPFQEHLTVSHRLSSHGLSTGEFTSACQ